MKMVPVALRTRTNNSYRQYGHTYTLEATRKRPTNNNVKQDQAPMSSYDRHKIKSGLSAWQYHLASSGRCKSRALCGQVINRINLKHGSAWTKTRCVLSANCTRMWSTALATGNSSPIEGFCSKHMDLIPKYTATTNIYLLSIRRPQRIVKV